MGTSVCVTWLTVTVTASIATARRDRQRPQGDRPVGSAFRRGSRRRCHRRGTCRLAGGKLHCELIAHDHHELHDAEQEHEQQWQAQGQFDRGLASVASRAAVRACR